MHSDELINEQKKEIAEYFVYSCLLDIMKADGRNGKSNHTYYLGKEDYARYKDVFEEIKVMAREENLNVEFKLTCENGKNEYLALVSRV